MTDLSDFLLAQHEAPEDDEERERWRIEHDNVAEWALRRMAAITAWGVEAATALGSNAAAKLSRSSPLQAMPTYPSLATIIVISPRVVGPKCGIVAPIPMREPGRTSEPNCVNRFKLDRASPSAQMTTRARTAYRRSR